MKEKTGEIFSIAKDNPPVPGCTVSRAVYSAKNDIIYFSLAGNTDISAENYPCHKLLVVADGQLEVCGTDGFSRTLREGDSIITLTNTPVGMRTKTGAIY